MKQTLLLTLFSFTISVFMTACTGQMADTMAVVSESTLSSNSCHAIDKKLMKLDEFTTMVNNTSAFHLEEKVAAISTPGITASNNKKQMLRDAKKKYAELSAERQEYGCETPMTSNTDKITDKMAVLGSPGLSSDPCAAIDKKLVKLDEFTIMVNNTSAFHLEEKAAALPVPGITASNNKKKMLRDAKKKRAALSAERQKYSCDTPMYAGTAQMADTMAVVAKPTLSSDPSAAIDKKIMKPDEFTTKVNNTSVVHVEEKAAALPVPGITVTKKKEEILRDAEKKQAELEVEHQKYTVETPMTSSTDKMAVVGSPGLSSDPCAAIDNKLIKLYEFMIMVNNTSAFHLEEKASALSVPGITVSNNKKKMLRDAEKKHAELSAERQKYGCETSGK